MNILPTEIIIEIFKYLSFNELIKLELVNKFIKLIIRTNKWRNITVKPKDNSDIINFFIDNYSFINYDFSFCNQITDASVSLLANCHKLDLSGCNQITDSMKAKLKETVKNFQY